MVSLIVIDDIVTSCNTVPYAVSSERPYGPAVLGWTTQPLIDVSLVVIVKCVLVLALTVAFNI